VCDGIVTITTIATTITIVVFIVFLLFCRLLALEQLHDLSPYVKLTTEDGMMTNGLRVLPSA
jgi:hypothetical protein